MPPPPFVLLLGPSDGKQLSFALADSRGGGGCFFIPLPGGVAEVGDVFRVFFFAFAFPCFHFVYPL